MIQRMITGVLLLLCLAACDPEIPTLEPTRTLTGPTIAPSADPFIFGPPTEHAGQSDMMGDINATAAALPAGGVLPPVPVGPTSPAGAELVQIAVAEDFFLDGELYQTGAERLPGLLLWGDDSPVVWGDLPHRLRDAGFVVLVVPLWPEATAGDLSLLLETLTTGLADPSYIGVIASGQSADLALIGCADDPLCDTVVMLSPLNQQGLLSALPRYNPRPLLQVVTEQDADSFSVAQAVHNAATGEKMLQGLNNAGRGLAILQNRSDVGDLIIEWMQRYLYAQ